MSLNTMPVDKYGAELLSEETERQSPRPRAKTPPIVAPSPKKQPVTPKFFDLGLSDNWKIKDTDASRMSNVV
jgi:hypothetical protein